MTRKEKILAFISHDEYVPMKAGEIAILMGVSKKERPEFQALISELETEGEIYKNSKGRYLLLQNSGLIKGVFEAKSKKYGFITDDNDEKYFVAPGQNAGAFSGDVVLAKLTVTSKNFGKCSECSVVRVISHGKDKIVGTFEKAKNFGFVIPDDKSFNSDIYISKKHSAGIANGQKVVVKITKWPSDGNKPEGVIDEILGFATDAGVDIKSLMRRYSLNEEFPQKVELCATAFGDEICETEFSGREDFRNNMIFTIDGDNSKDFDDAVEIKKTDSGYILGVHIADVSYYVSENSSLDIEARKRGTSVYFPGSVVPMLPEKLSNGLCSLNPYCNRLTLSVIMEFDNDANLKKHRICESVICSKYRLTYNNVASLLDGDKTLNKEYSDIAADLFTMNELAVKLKSKRLEKGSIDFDFPETAIVLDEYGKCNDVYSYRPGKAHKIIEEFMLSANTCVAEEMFWCDLPFVYRIHEKPSKEKVNSFKNFVQQLGYTLNIKADNPQPGVFAKFYDSIRETPKEMLISKMMLRTLMKARYSDENLGHFGLGFKYYCHFTSPIRRYPDLVIHRIIKEHIKDELTSKRLRYLRKFVKEASLSSSRAELTAMEAERDADDMKKAEFMSDKIGNVYPAVISSIASFGMFAETDFGVEGFVSLSELNDDYYEFNEGKLILTGKNTGKTYNIGDRIYIKVKRSDPILREIDYSMEEELNG